MISILALAMVAAMTDQPAGWSVTESVGATGATDTRAALSSLDGQALVLRCQGDNKLVTIQYLPGADLGPPGKLSVMMRFDKAGTVSGRWTRDGRSVSATDTKDVSDFARRALKSSRLMMNTEDSKRQPVGANFVLAGAQAPISKVFAACGYPDPAAPKS